MAELAPAASGGGHLMDYDKLIERLYQHDKDYGEGRTQDFFRVCLDCKDAATALSTLQAENAQLRADLEYEREHANAYHEECGQWEAENEKMRAELDAARAALAELTGLAHASLHRLSAVFLERMWALSHAELEGRSVGRA